MVLIIPFSTMVRRACHGGIGAIGSGVARFFHPGERIHKRWPAKAWHCIFSSVITGEEERRVGQRQQMCYLVTILDFREGVTFHIVKKNFQVNVDPKTVFASKVTTANPLPPPVVDADLAPMNNVVPNVFGGAGLCEEIKQLRAEGLEVEDNNEPLPEDAVPALANPEGMGYEYTIPTFCHLWSNSNIVDSPGQWVQYWWDEIAEKLEFNLFRMCFPKDSIREFVLPSTNNHLVPQLIMQEFYK
jgi:hypothetical protein